MGQNYLSSIPQATKIHLSARNGPIRLKMSPNYVISQSPLAISRLHMSFQSMKTKTKIRTNVVLKASPLGSRSFGSFPNLHLYNSLYSSLFIKVIFANFEPKRGEKKHFKQIVLLFTFLTFQSRAKRKLDGTFFLF